jgi:hypothetical protein
MGRVDAPSDHGLRTISETQVKIALQSRLTGDPSSGLNDSHHRCSHGVREVAPGGNDGSEIAIGFCEISSGFGSTRRTRHDARCRLLTRITFVMMRRKLLDISGFRREMSRAVATRRMFRKSGGGGNCTRVPSDASYFLNSLCEKRTQGLSELCRECVALRELVTNWHRLTPEVRDAIMELAWSCQPVE